MLRLFRDEAGEPLCIACKACQRICPTHCFDIEGARPEGSKVMRPTKFDWKLDRCTSCGLCVEVCPTDAIRFSNFRMSAWGGRAPFHLPTCTLWEKSSSPTLRVPQMMTFPASSSSPRSPSSGLC
jgi:formate hydrogenlyase subunit 6/NADH:ubiquinone oxidoreductase subunit I